MRPRHQAPSPARGVVRIRRGLDLPFAGVPAPVIEDANPVRTVALMPPEHAGLHVEMAVREGEHVLCGQPLFIDRNAPEILFTSPRAGVVQRVERGARRTVQSVIVEVGGDAPWRLDRPDPAGKTWEDGDEVRRRLLAAGLWPALRSRPFGHIPRPNATAHAIFVTAMDTNPLAGPTHTVLSPHLDDLARGVRALATLTAGIVHVCVGAAPELPPFEHPRIRVTRFLGPHPAGLVGTHMQHLAPPRRGRPAWYLGWQDVVAIGRLAATGVAWGERYVALGGALVRRPRWLRTVPGACVGDLVDGEIENVPCRVVSGSILSGRQASSWSAHLGRYHTQVSVLGEPGAGDPGRRHARPFSYHHFLDRWRRRVRPTTSLHGAPAPLVPLDSFERVMPRGILPTMLLRALQIGDLETAERLGCLELEEEDLALCTYLCPSKIDHGAALRRALDELRAEAPEGVA